MTTFRAFLVLAWLILVGYTSVVVANHGWGLFAIFFGDMKAMAWPGQFNLDFTFMLIFSALWVAWRHHFSALGLALGLLALFLGSGFLATYLFILTWRERGDMKLILLGPHRGAP